MEFFLKGTEIKLPFKTFDKEIGKTYLPNSPINEIKEGLYINQTNQYGFIGNVSLKKKPNTIRIAVFGDSFVEAFQLDPKFNFCSILERNLNKAVDNKTIEVINFGLSNSVLPDVYIRKKLLAEKFDIDYCIYFFDSYDLILDSQSTLDPVKIINSNNKLQIVKNQSKAYELYYKAQTLIDNTSLINMIMEAYILHARGESRKIILDKFYQPETTAFDYSYYDYYFKNLTDLQIKMLKELLNDKSLFILNEKAEPALENTLKKYNFKFYETYPVLENLRQKGVNPYFWENSNMEGHFNYHAHEAIGNYLTFVFNKKRLNQ
ncbi:SGNH/GDSL hydrolase family protein [Flavobacterium sp. H122]|uniref:SGNH/GDSL hydrolase family protein n=1 Tax=Flavobacterium sp. H122 TaxID=2529860 RepID=UPI0010AA81C8|nr:SGNH/GDSL hydrolase family protein [Flavobacterium sp. H122]